MTLADIKTQYEQHGYVAFRNVFEDDELAAVHEVLERFHERWLGDHAEFYNDSAINSAYLTGTQYLDDDDRMTLFQFIGSRRISNVLRAIIPVDAMFVNTQLFFDPANPEQKNYWHRDIQYSDLSVDQQRALLKTSNPLHLRVALKPERGVELVPGTHRRWDADNEFDVRMGNNGCHAYDDLPNGQAVGLDRGDLLLFSAGMIHRGLYGGDRFSFDLLFGDADAAVVVHIDDDCLPNDDELLNIECPEPFVVTRRLKQQEDS